MSKKNGATFERADKQSEAFHFGLEEFGAVDPASTDNEQATAVADDDGHAGSQVSTRLRHGASASKRGDRHLNVVGFPHPTGREFAIGIKCR
jgi:hypothetical protein